MNISVIIPCYNGQAYLEETLESIQNQITAPYEVILIDDASRDKSAEIFKAWADLDHPFSVRYHRNKTNTGIGYTRNAGLHLAQGDHVAFLSADDTYDPWFIALTSPEAGKFRDAGIFTNYYRCDELLRPFRLFQAPGFKTQEHFKVKAIAWALRKNMFVNFSSVVFPTNWRQILSFEEKLRHGEDLIFLLDSILEGLPWRHVKDPLVNYRVHGKQGTRLISNDLDEWQDLWYHMIVRLYRLGVNPEVYVSAYHANYRHLFPSIPNRLLTRLKRIWRYIKASHGLS